MGEDDGLNRSQSVLVHVATVTYTYNPHRIRKPKAGLLSPAVIPYEQLK